MWNETPPRAARGTLVTVLTLLSVLLPLGFAGWLVWETASPGPGATAGPGGERPSPTGEPGPPRPDGSPDRPLAGRTVVIDPGHNPGNRNHTARIGRPVDAGTHRKECDTTGTATNSGYPEAEFTLDVARRAREELRRLGATVRLTHDGDRPYGPCVDERARFGNHLDADAVVSVHADGAAAGDRGFHVILPAVVRAGAADTAAIAGPSRRLGTALAAAFRTATGSRPAGYLGGGDGLVVRDDLGGLNLSRVPKVFLECGNMRDPADAARLSDPDWRKRAARGVADGVAAFLGAAPAADATRGPAP